METVPNQPPEGEPNNITPSPWRCEVHGGGLGWCEPTDNIPCAATFYNDAIGHRPGYVAGECGHAVALSEWRAGFRVCERCPDPRAPEVVEETPERRTVSLEVLTDELREAEDDRRREQAHEASKMRMDGELEKPNLLPASAKVGIVLRLDGEPVLVPETDAEWVAGFRQPADVLEALLRQARFYADDHDDAELLMLTPDVLAVLAGKPATFWTKPVNMSVVGIEPGWQLVGDVDGVQTFETVLRREYCSGSDGCTDEDCIILVVHDGRPLAQPGTLIVPALSGQRVHLLGWLRPQVRIPADQAVEL